MPVAGVTHRSGGNVSAAPAKDLHGPARLASICRAQRVGWGCCDSGNAHQRAPTKEKPARAQEPPERGTGAQHGGGSCSPVTPIAESVVDSLAITRLKYRPDHIEDRETAAMSSQPDRSAISPPICAARSRQASPRPIAINTTGWTRSRGRIASLTRPSERRSLGGVGLGRGAGIAAGPFPQAAR